MKRVKNVISVILAVLILFSSFICVFATETKELTKAEQIVEVARAEYGYYGEGSNKFAEWYYGVPSTAAWCAIFISWCANEVGVLGSAIPKKALCSDMLLWFKNKGVYHDVKSDYVPQKGDVIFFDTDGSGVTHHVEFVAEDGFITDENGTVYVRCIGGNTSDLDFNGLDHVTERDRALNDSRAVVMGYAHPDYAKEKSNDFNSFIEAIRDFFNQILAFFRSLFS